MSTEVNDMEPVKEVGAECSSQCSFTEKDFRKVFLECVPFGFNDPGSFYKSEDEVHEAEDVFDEWFADLVFRCTRVGEVTKRMSKNQETEKELISADARKCMTSLMHEWAKITYFVNRITMSEIFTKLCSGGETEEKIKIRDLSPEIVKSLNLSWIDQDSWKTRDNDLKKGYTDFLDTYFIIREIDVRLSNTKEEFEIENGLVEKAETHKSVGQETTERRSSIGELQDSEIDLSESLKSVEVDCSL